MEVVIEKPHPLLTVAETAQLLRVSRRTVYRFVESGEVAAVRIGGQWRVVRAELPEGLRGEVA